MLNDFITSIGLRMEPQRLAVQELVTSATVEATAGAGEEEMIDLTQLETLAQAATPGPWTTVPTSIPNESLLQIGAQVSFGSRSIQLSTQDATFIAACSPDVVLALVARVRELETLGQIVQREAAYYDQAWLEEHAKNDHMNTMDHKDEMSVAESLLVIKMALTPSEPQDG